MKVKTNLSLITLLISGSCFAGLNEGIEAASNHDYATAIANWRPLAIAGNATAQTNMGNLYRDGLGVPVDYVQALSLYYSAAKEGDSAAQFNMGNMYKLGLGVKKDFIQAVSWYRMSLPDVN